MNLSRRGFFKGIAALAAGVVAAQLPSCTTGGAPLAVASEPKAPWWKGVRVEHTIGPVIAKPNKNAVGWMLSPGNINKYKHEILAHAIPGEALAFGTTPLPYSLAPLVEGLTPTPAALLERGQPVG